MHPPFSEIQMKKRANGIFAGETLPASSVYFGTDASGGPRGADPRLRVVSWAVVAICECPGVGGGERLVFQIVGSMTGALQIGATVNDGESYALNQLAEWPVCVAVDSQVTIKRCKQMPGIWTAMPFQRDRLRISWTKSHLTKEERGQRFGTSKAWVWAANQAADEACSLRSQEKGL